MIEFEKKEKKMNEEKIIPMTYDKMFKSVLKSKEARQYLVDIIGDITGIPKDNIRKNMVIKDPEYKVNSISEKRKVSDMVVEIKDGVINLEMNKDYYEGLIDRNHDYMLKIRQEMIKEGEDYKDIKKVIQINFDNYNQYKPDKRVVIVFEMMDKQKGIKEGVNMQSYHIILPNVKEKYYNERSKDALVGKLVIMMAKNCKELEELIRKNQELRPLGEKLVEISRDEELMGLYDEEEHKRKVRNTQIRTALEDGWNKGMKKGIKEGLEKGIKEGIEKGIEQGIKQGIQQGIEQGIKQGRKQGIQQGGLSKQKEIAKNLLKQNVDLQIITIATGISKEELKSLNEEN